jgi:thioesterase domain-containing protein
MPTGLLTQYLTLFCGHAELLRGFAVPDLRAPLAVWHASAQGRAAAGWAGRRATLLADHVLAGAHYDLMHPPLVNTLAAQLSAVLNRLAPTSTPS